MTNNMIIFTRPYTAVIARTQVDEFLEMGDLLWGYYFLNGLDPDMDNEESYPSFAEVPKKVFKISIEHAYQYMRAYALLIIYRKVCRCYKYSPSISVLKSLSRLYFPNQNLVFSTLDDLRFGKISKNKAKKRFNLERFSQPTEELKQFGYDVPDDLKYIPLWIQIWPREYLAIVKRAIECDWPQ